MRIWVPSCKIKPTEELIGGKAYNLAQLQTKFPVPAWFGLTTHAFTEFIHELPQNNIAEHILNTPLPTGIHVEIEQTVTKLNMSDKYLAVRSSAAGEDGEEFSYAGQLETLLYVRGNDLEKAIKQVWASAYSDRCESYRKQHGLETKPIEMGVIIQEMVDADCSGVAFGADPVSGDRNTTVISAVFGLGEGLVSGLLDADCYRIINGNVEQTIATKKQAVLFDNEHEYNTKVIDLPLPKQNIPCLNPDQITELAQIIYNISQHYNSPQDVEWSLQKDQFYILQSRPITFIGKPNPKRTRTLWDNSNIIESYSGVTTPLTFSFIQEVYTIVYQDFCMLMGVEENLIRQNENIFQMLGLLNGRVYYNLLHWYQALSLLPGYEINARFMEEMMGVKERMDLLPSVVHSKNNPYLRLYRMIFRLITRFFGLPRNIRRFYQVFNETIDLYDINSFESLEGKDLVAIYHDLSQKLLHNWQAPLVNDFFAMIFFGLVKKLIIHWKIDKQNTLQNDLLTGEGGIISTEPVEGIIKIANQIHQHEQLRTAFLEMDSEQLLIEIKKYPQIQSMIEYHLTRFGIRCANELKLETVTYQHEPKLLIGLIKNYVRQGVISIEAAKKREEEIRVQAEEQVKLALRRHPLRRLIFNLILRQTRLKVKNRENLRFERTRIFALVRELFLALGRRLHKHGVLEQSRDVFYLSKEEIFAYFQGNAVSTDLRGTVELRRREYQAYLDIPMPDRFETFGSPYLYNNKFSQSTERDAGDLKGTGCSPGIVKARVRIITNPMDSSGLEGCILVTERTDPGWAPLFPLAEGILVERGSLLSHSAIVAREMGIPAIVSITNLTQLLNDGELVEMDGSTGIIKKVEE